MHKVIMASGLGVLRSNWLVQSSTMIAHTHPARLKELKALTILRCDLEENNIDRALGAPSHMIKNP